MGWPNHGGKLVNNNICRDMAWRKKNALAQADQPDLVARPYIPLVESLLIFTGGPGAWTVIMKERK